MPLEHFYESIPGWFNFQDIYREQVERARDGAVFVEVGSWLGRSTAFMAVEIANSGKQITFYAVDTWLGSPGPQYQDVVAQHGGSVYEVFGENLRRGGVDGVVCPLIGTSTEMAQPFADGSIDFVFLDGAHDFHSVSRDVCTWKDKLRHKATFAGHDANCPGLMNAVKQWIPGRTIRYLGTSWIVTRESDHARFDHPVRRFGVIDQALEEWQGVDYRRRMLLGGASEAEVTVVLGNPYIPPTPPDRYIAKWGGPPGQEVFAFPYGVSTEDW
jgi:Methyltransferase domain